jgi:geranylgeranyl pyrophosphate synthase
MTINVAKSYPKITASPWNAEIRNEMLAVEGCLRDLINSAVPTASELSQHLLAAGGKRVRPALVMLSAKACGRHDLLRAATIAACCEMIHMATLVHDDVICLAEDF